jgi:site-specific DNA-methyltransferase (adenine-specific)
MIVEQMLNLPQNPKWDIARVSHSTLVNADCFEVFPFIEDKSIDAIICDLPYGTTQCKWDSVLPFDKLWEQYERIIKPNGAIVLTANQPFTSALIMSNLKLFRYEWIWEKSRPTGFPMAKHRPMKNHETIVVFSKSPATYTQSGFMKYYPQGVEECDRIIKSTNRHKTVTNGGDLGNEIHSTQKGFPKTILKIKNTNNDSKNHPTEKPVELMEYLIKTYTNENDLVLDNTMGSGTTGVACKNTNRNFIGIEKEPKYYEIACQRCGF